MKELRILLWLMVMAVAIPMQAQTDDETIEDDSDTLSVATEVIDSLATDSVMLPWPQSMQHHVDRLLQSDMFQTSQLGLMVYDLDADSVLYRHNERQLMRPASTQKVITAIAAIDKLGGDYQLKTELCYTGSVENGVLKGDIYCVGGFDPAFNRDDMRAFVEAIHKMGVDTIVGHIYADKSMKEEATLGEGWCWDDDNPTLSPLLVGRKDVFVSKFMTELRDAGIVLNVYTGTARKPEDAYCIIRRYHTIDQVLMRMLKESDNLYAEAMFYQLAASTGNHPATAKSARAVIRRLISKLGLDASRYKIADGSGLSLYNYVSAELEVKMLRYAYRNVNIYRHLQPSLPTAGVDGTLRKRMLGTFTHGKVWAKTGTVTGISSLAGYAMAANGHTICFSIINQGVMHGRNGRAFQDRVCTAICEP